jgi:ABC-type xylose transport system substrate-binding protein
MAKPVVRIVLDKDTLQKLIPEGHVEAYIAFDNSVVNLLNETASRIVDKELIGRMARKIEDYAYSALEGRYMSGRTPCEEIIKQGVNAVAEKLIKEHYEKAGGDASLQIDNLIKQRLSYVEKLVTEMTTPEGVENLLVKACAALVKGKIK